MTSDNIIKLLLVTFLLAAATVSLSDARGGRGRGGGSFGGLFGGWRKYKKPSSSGSGRRTISGSPYQPLSSSDGIKSHSSSSGGSSGLAFASKQSKTHASYPKQQMPTSNTGGTATGGRGYYSGGHGYYGGGAAGASAASPPIPPGGAYYANTAAMPAGAIYYAQPPIYSSSSSGTGNFLFGMMAGHMLSNGLFGHRPYVTHVYQQSPQPTDNGGRVIVINNGNATDQTATAADAATPNYWPMDADVPLAPFNATITPGEAYTPAATAASPPPAMPQSPGATPQAGGIICVPMIFNETDPNDANATQQVEKIVCYPAPPPPLPSPAEVPDAANCITRIVTEVDPNDPTKSIEVPKKDCAPLTTSQPPIVAGEIGESAGGGNDTASSVPEEVEIGH